MKTIQKSVRLPEYLVRFIEKQPGDNFSHKLVLLLENVFFDEKIWQKLKSQREELARNDQKLSEQYAVIMEVDTVLRKMAGILSFSEEQAEEGGSDRGG